MPLNKVNADSIADGTVVASDIADGTITLAKLQSGLLPTATANSAAAYANAAFATANTGTASGSYANSAFAVANSAASYANSAFAAANSATATDVTQNTNITSASTYANGAFIKANSAVSLTANVSGTLPVGNGGTGATTLTSNNVLLGNGTSAVNFVAPGTNGNILTSNGTTWTSAAPSGGVTSVNGQTGAVVTTTFDSIGSIGIFMCAQNSDVAPGATIAGSSLRYNHSVFDNAVVNFPFSGYARNVNNSSYNGGGSSVSGTWRKMNTGTVYYSYFDCGNGFTFYRWLHMLCVRVS